MEKRISQQVPNWPRYGGLIAAIVAAYFVGSYVWPWSNHMNQDYRMTVTAIASVLAFLIAGKVVMEILEFIYEAYRDAVDTRTRPNFLAVAIAATALTVSILTYFK